MTNRRQRGRPPGSLNLKTIARQLAKEKVALREGDSTKTLTVFEAVIRKLQHLSMKGDVTAMQEMERLLMRMRPEEEQERAGILLVPEPLSEAEWIRQAKIANRFKSKPEMPDPPRTLVEGSTSPPAVDRSAVSRPAVPRQPPPGSPPRPRGPRLIR